MENAPRFPPTLDTLRESTSAHRATGELFLYGKEDRTKASSHPHAGVTPGGIIVRNRGPKVLEIDSQSEATLPSLPFGASKEIPRSGFTTTLLGADGARPIIPPRFMR